tara:strand:- start:24908 stop:26932 length:2025 start_codon:yes stop_codon:yes gene_type:complete
MVYEIKLKGGLCNKLFCLFSGVEIAIKEKEKLLEPNFGLTNEILFSDIYDIDFFNKNMRKYTGLKEFMIPKKIYNSSNILIVKKVLNGNKLWNISEKNLKKQRNENMMKMNCMNVIVLNSLRLNSENLKLVNIINNIENKNAVHIRIENDWVQYSKTKKVIKNETLLIKLETLINIYKEKWNNSELFFTTGENHDIILEKLKENNIGSKYFFLKNKNYEINAAINFELCLRSKNFVGLSRSTFSNLVTLKRCLNDKKSNYIYNYNEQILLRIDMGLHPNPKKSINNKVILENNKQCEYDFVLNNGNKFPAIGLGIGNMQKERIPDVVKNATLLHGIKLVDTNQRAAITCNTDIVLQDNPGLQVVTKVRYTHLGYERTILAVEDMLKGLNGCCEVTMLIHWPRCRDSWKERCKKEEENLPQRIRDAGPPPIEDYFAWKGSWKALEEFYIHGKLKNIGISNFDINDLNELLSFCKVVPQLYQGNAWQLWFRPKVIDLLKKEKILFQAYNVVDGIVNRQSAAPNAYKALTNIAKSKNADLCTIVLAVLKKMEIATIPRASSPNHIKANAPQTVCSLNISDNEAKTLDYVMKALMCGKDLDRELRVFVTFSCSNESDIKIYWKNAETGKEVLQGTINNNKCLRVSTNKGHIFNAYNEKNLLNSFVVSENVGQKEEFFI